MDFYLYNVIHIQGFKYIITLVCENTRIVWVLPNASEKASLRVICFIITTLNNAQHTCKCVRIDEDGALKNSIFLPTF